MDGFEMAFVRSFVRRRRRRFVLFVFVLAPNTIFGEKETRSKTVTLFSVVDT
jgi:hypothetical protein